MTEIDIVSSGSAANGYLLKSGGQILILELGCKFSDYVEHLNTEDFRLVRGCLVSHRRR